MKSPKVNPVPSDRLLGGHLPDTRFSAIRRELGSHSTTLVAVATLVLTLLIPAGPSADVGPLWGPETQLPAVDPDSDVGLWVGPNMVINSNDQIRIVYLDDQATGNRLQILFSPDGGTTWLGPDPFPPSDSLIGANGVNLAIDRLDNIHAVFLASNPAGVLYARRDALTGNWSDPVQLFSSDVSASPTLTLDRALRVHVFWHEGRLEAGSDTSEVWYARSTDNGDSFETPQMLSADDGLPSAFPRADFSGTGSDTLAVAWRDSVGGDSDWDVMAGITTNGGETWSRTTASGGFNAQWDPGMVVDRHGVFHLHYHEYGDFKTRIRYQKSSDFGATWSSPITLSDPTVHSELTVFAYNFETDTQWILWKDLELENRLFQADIACSYTLDGGVGWSTPEFATDLDSISSVGYKKCALARDGTLLIDYEYTLDDHARLYFRSRPPASAGIGDPIKYSELPKLALAPQPASTSVRAIMRLESPGRVKLRIFDVLGREIGCAVDASFSKRDLQVPVDISGLKNGVYFWQLEAGESSVATKLYVVR